MTFSLKAAVQEEEKVGKTFVGWIVKEYAAFYKNEPSLVKVVDATATYVEEGLNIVLATTGAAALVGPVDAVVNEAVSDLKVASALVYDFGPTPNSAAIFAAVQSNLASLETAGHVKDPATLAKLKLIINAVGTVAQLIAKAVTAASAPAVPSAS